MSRDDVRTESPARTGAGERRRGLSPAHACRHVPRHLRRGVQREHHQCGARGHHGHLLGGRHDGAVAGHRLHDRDLDIHGLHHARPGVRAGGLGPHGDAVWLAGHMFRAAGGRRDRRRLGRPAHAQRGQASQRPAQRALARPACRRAHGVRLLRGRAVRKPAVWRLRPGGRARTRRDVRAPAACARAAAARHPSHAELAVLAGVRASRGDDDDVVPHERAVAALLRGGLLA